MTKKLRFSLTVSLVPLLLGLSLGGCDSSGSGSSAPASVTPPVSAAPPVSPIPSFDPARTVTVFVNGFDPGGATSTGDYGDDRVSNMLRRMVGKLNMPTGDLSPAAPNQITEVEYYGTNPPAYYSAQDLIEVDQAPRGVPRYARVVAKFIRHVLARSGADHVNLIGASLGGLITRYVIEQDLEGLASAGKIVRWLTVEGTAGGVWVAEQASRLPLLTQLLQAAMPNLAFDLSDLPSMSYSSILRDLNTPDPRRSTSPYLANMIVGFTISGDFDAFQQLMQLAAGAPNDGLLLVRDQALQTIDAKPGHGAAVVHTDTDHLSAARDEGLAVNVVNALRSRRRARVRLVSATLRAIPEHPSQGAGEIVFCTRVRSPAAQQEWGVSDPISARNEIIGTAPMALFAAGDVRSMDEVLFDWFVAPNERALQLQLAVREIDLSAFYSVYEVSQHPSSPVDEGTLLLPVDALGRSTYVLDTPGFRAEVEVEVFDE